MRNFLLICAAVILSFGASACKKAPFYVSSNDFKKSLPDAAYNSNDNNYFVFWAAVPNADSTDTNTYIMGQKISPFGKPAGKPVAVLETENIVALPHSLYLPNTNQYMVLYCMYAGGMNVYGVILDEDGKAMGDHFRVTDTGNQFHFTMALDTAKNQILVTYNDRRTGFGNIYGVILDETGQVVKNEFVISDAAGHQVNPVACYNPDNATYLINWEDFRQHDNITVYETLEVMTNIQGSLLDDNGSILVEDIPMCVDDNDTDADQRFNGIAYNPDKNEFLVTWTDTRESQQNIGIKGRIVKADGSMPGADFTVVDGAGAQMISHAAYVPKNQQYLIAFEYDVDDLDEFYFKDITAQLNIGAQWLDSDGLPTGPIADIYSSDGNQRFVRFAHNTRRNNFLMVWQDDFPGVSDTVDSHIMSAGGDIMGALYK